MKLTNLVRPSIAALKPYSSARDEYQGSAASMVFLDANENPFETKVNRYPDPQQQQLKGVLTEKRGVTNAQILLGNGSDEVLDLLFRAFCEPSQDNIITLPPTYGMYSVLAGINDVENREVLLTPEFQPDIEAILNAQDARSKLLFICSPNNPTGNSISEEKIVALLEGFNGLVVVDEAYIDFAETPSWVARLHEYDNLVVTQTLSKAYGMAGIRLGMCYANPEVISILNKIKPPYNVNVLTQEYALRYLQNEENFDNRKNLILNEKELLSKKLLQVGFISKIYSSNANFILVKVDDANRRYTELLNEGVVVRNRSTQPLCHDTLRITVGSPDENKKLLTAMKTIS
ncbi:MAG: histidinol-phosphate transaminase [Flavobacteriaceae bacterium]|nr:histidinol-phosphate transaminase [Flavobacteriaceae bacterium]